MSTKRIFLLAVLGLGTVGLNHFGVAREEAALQVRSAQRAADLVLSRGGDFGHSGPEKLYAAKNRAKDILLVVAVDTFAEEEWEAAMDEVKEWEAGGKGNGIYVQEDTKRHQPKIIQQRFMMGPDKNRYCCVLVFAVPKTAQKFDLVLGGRSVFFETNEEVVERVNMSDLCK